MLKYSDMVTDNIIGTLLLIKNKLFSKNLPINIGEQLAHVNRVLIYMPSKIEQFGAALKSLETLRKLKPKWQITVITKLEMVSFLDNKLKVDIIPFSKEDINFLGLPKSSLTQLIQNTTFDLALDFKLKFDILSVILFRRSNAPIRVCFNSKNNSYFYNFEIRVNPSESLTNKYNVMVKYITVIADSSRPKAPISNKSKEVKE